MVPIIIRSPGLRARFYFFFQAEDGIRDLTVTGVQTCALPISRAEILDTIANMSVIELSQLIKDMEEKFGVSAAAATVAAAPAAAGAAPAAAEEIGRASCRERV